MTAKEYLLEKFDNSQDQLDQFLYDFSKDCDLSDIVIAWLAEYAKIKCDEQKDLCLANVIPFEESDSILNSPYPQF